MATLLRAVCKASSLASRAGAMAVASRRSACPGVAAAASLGPGSGALDPLKCLNPRRMSARGGDDDVFPSHADYPHLPDDAKTPTDKDLESDEALWALYERWCKAFRKQRDHAEMTRRFKIFKYHARYAHDHNTHVPEDLDPEEAAIFVEKRREAALILDKGEDISHLDEWTVPYRLGRLADGGDPDLREYDYDLLNMVEKSEAELVEEFLKKCEARRADKDVTVE